jgi:hypothetical protein
LENLFPTISEGKFYNINSNPEVEKGNIESIKDKASSGHELHTSLHEEKYFFRIQ